MKNPAILILTFIHMLHLNNNALCQTSDVKENNALTYLIMINSEEQEHQAEFLISSIRRFGGIYSAMPVIVVNSDPARFTCSSLVNKANLIVNLEMPESLRVFPFADKVYACAQVEKMVAGKTDWLLWINPDGLMVAPPVEIFSDTGAWASLRPVHIQNVGIGQSQAIPEYWKKIYAMTDVDTNSLWLIESFVDNKQLKPYYNSGCMAFRPEKGILSQWKSAFETMLNNKAIYSTYSNDQYGSFFFHQAVLSAIIISKAGKERINILPPSYGYPLSLQNRQDFLQKMHYIDEMKVILCEDYQNLQYLIIGETYSSCLEKEFVYSK